MITREEAKKLIKTEQQLLSEKHVEDCLIKVEEWIRYSASIGKDRCWISRGGGCYELPLTVVEFRMLKSKLIGFGYDISPFFYYDPNHAVELIFG